MMTFTADDIQLKSAPTQAFRGTLTQALWFVILMGITGVLGLFMYLGGAQPSTIAWLIYLIGMAAILYQPRYGIYLLLFLTLVSDGFLLYWYPFSKNFSSQESLLYLNDSLVFSPLEFYFVLTFISWLARGAIQRKWEIYLGVLTWPAIVFIGFITFGLVYGIGTGGSMPIGLWEARPIFYLPMALILASNLLTKRKHVDRMMWSAMIALFIEGIIGVYTFFVLLGGERGHLEAITEHSAAIHMNTLFVLALGVWLFKGSRAKRIILPLMVPPVLLTYLITERRSSFVALVVALLFMTILLFRENRAAFYLIVPPIAFIGMVYIAAFWNSSGALAMPAQAIKSVIAEDQASLKDQRSNLYRMIENTNSDFTIHEKPLTGVGFGQKFYMLIPMPDISFFEWWEYITHNSIIWIWMKTGIGGFFSLMFLIGMSVMTGVRVLWRMPRNDLSAAAMTAVLYIIMHFIYAYVDMSWDNQSMVYVGMMMGLLNGLERIVEKPVPVKSTRWPWQPEEPPAPEIVPLPESAAS
ncbi:MAG: O-antigen ligase family protein [Chloroflexi bacterium]|nr:O-antigen ligase family protein [Chloroflexota bacterium]